MTETKKCSKCGEEFTINQISKTTGNRPICKPCNAKYKRDHYHNNPEARKRQIAASRKWTLNNKERHLQYCRNGYIKRVKNNEDTTK